MSPFQVNDLTKQLVIDNISYLLNNFSSCPSFEYVICCWVMDSQDILDALEAKLKVTKEQLVTISLVCQEEQLIQRLQKDIEHHRRQPDSIPNSLARIANYKELNTIKVNVSDLTPLEAAKAIEQVVVGMVPKSNS
ncbi:hypothetical protein I6N95_06920 [Vagococcus sp. BWB3-3]|uniref:Shikimate kinase n=1 Tax=Vagococcus allomyrinae TaxID=2794353 RepID=A0A940PC27_9ENTE|nr:hypothetical protein [Vagococcus allomyrinae]MBP1040731.1 hypothetical protein [Vagococcus allomyrinae]